MGIKPLNTGDIFTGISSKAMSMNSLVNDIRASVHQAAKLVAALLRVVAGVNAGLAESNGSLPSGL